MSGIPCLFSKKCLFLKNKDDQGRNREKGKRHIVRETQETGKGERDRYRERERERQERWEGERDRERERER